MKKTATFAAGAPAAPTLPAFPSPEGAPADLELTAELADQDWSENSLSRLGRVPIAETDNLDETVLGSAAVGDPDIIAPEVVKGTEALTEWDEPADATGTWTPREGLDDGMPDAARLYEAGIEEADRERRLAAHESDDV